MKLSTREIAAATGGRVSHVTVGTFLRGERVSTESRAAIESAIKTLESARRREASDRALGRIVRTAFNSGDAA